MFRIQSKGLIVLSLLLNTGWEKMMIWLSIDSNIWEAWRPLIGLWLRMTFQSFMIPSKVHYIRTTWTHTTSTASTTSWLHLIKGVNSISPMKVRFFWLRDSTFQQDSFGLAGSYLVWKADDRGAILCAWIRVWWRHKGARVVVGEDSQDERTDQ